MNSHKHIDELVLQYQETGNSEPLVKQYSNFINKYHKLFTTKQIDFSNYDIRRFLACYIKEKEIIKDLCREKYHSKKAIKQAYKVLDIISKAFEDYSEEDIYHELLIPFLSCAKQYKQKGKSFNRYLYHTYRYKLKKLIDEKLFDATDRYNLNYCDMYYKCERVPFYDLVADKPYPVEIDNNMDLNNILWLSGSVGDDIFKNLTYMERYILVKAYEESLTDIEIARLTGYHPRSIYRIRKRIKKYLMDLQKKGEIKWIKLSGLHA